MCDRDCPLFTADRTRKPDVVGTALKKMQRRTANVTAARKRRNRESSEKEGKRLMARSPRTNCRRREAAKRADSTGQQTEQWNAELKKFFTQKETQVLASQHSMFFEMSSSAQSKLADLVSNECVDKAIGEAVQSFLFEHEPVESSSVMFKELQRLTSMLVGCADKGWLCSKAIDRFHEQCMRRDEEKDMELGQTLAAMAPPICAVKRTYNNHELQDMLQLLAEDDGISEEVRSELKDAKAKVAASTTRISTFREVENLDLPMRTQFIVKDAVATMFERISVPKEASTALPEIAALGLDCTQSASNADDAIQGDVVQNLRDLSLSGSKAAVIDSAFTTTEELQGGDDGQDLIVCAQTDKTSTLSSTTADSVPISDEDLEIMSPSNDCYSDNVQRFTSIAHWAQMKRREEMLAKEQNGESDVEILNDFVPRERSAPCAIKSERDGASELSHFLEQDAEEEHPVHRSFEIEPLPENKPLLAELRNILRTVSASRSEIGRRMVERIKSCEVPITSRSQLVDFKVQGFGRTCKSMLALQRIYFVASAGSRSTVLSKSLRTEAVNAGNAVLLTQCRSLLQSTKAEKGRDRAKLKTVIQAVSAAETVVTSLGELRALCTDEPLKKGRVVDTLRKFFSARRVNGQLRAYIRRNVKMGEVSGYHLHLDNVSDMSLSNIAMEDRDDMLCKELKAMVEEGLLEETEGLDPANPLFSTFEVLQEW